MTNPIDILQSLCDSHWQAFLWFTSKKNHFAATIYHAKAWAVHDALDAISSPSPSAPIPTGSPSNIPPEFSNYKFGERPQ
jgi:hypothetical protein